MIKIKATFCQHCETPRFDSEFNGRCRFCNTPLYEKEIELPELSSSDKDQAEKYMEEQRTGPYSAEASSK